MGREGIIIGGGAAGLTAAIAAAERGAAVTVLEHTVRVGKKILSTGNGKCNLTNLRMEADCYRCGRPDFPMEAVGRFGVPETLRFFRKLGIVTKERNGYIYPASEQAAAVLDALKNRAEELGVRMVCEFEPGEIKKDGSGFSVTEAAGGKRKFSADFLILAAGSAAAPATGSDGSGYGLAASLGHSVKTPVPALVQLRCQGSGGFFKAAAGVRTEAAVRLFVDKKEAAADRGELQLTDYGLSGIPVFQVSRFAALGRKDGREVMASVDFYPAADREEFFELLKEQRGFLAAETASSFLNGIFNRKLAGQLLKMAGIGLQEPVEGLTDQELSRLCDRIKETSFSVTAVNPFDQAQVCAGGVDTEEIEPQTMESKLLPGLYFAGELLDVDGICGGYNLQWAWTSGYLAGACAAEEKREKRSLHR